MRVARHHRARLPTPKPLQFVCRRSSLPALDRERVPQVVPLKSSMPALFQRRRSTQVQYMTLLFMTMNPAPDYNEMKEFLRFFSERFLDQRTSFAQERPIAVLERQEQESASRASSGLRMAVNNCLEISSPWPLSQVVALDKEMHAKGLLSLSHVRSHVWGRYAAMLKRGQVRNNDEWVVARGILADASLARSLPEAQRRTLQDMVRSYRRPGP